MRVRQLKSTNFITFNFIFEIKKTYFSYLFINIRD